jgi:hypothetical protein
MFMTLSNTGFVMDKIRISQQNLVEISNAKSKDVCPDLTRVS